MTRPEIVTVGRRSCAADQLSTRNASTSDWRIIKRERRATKTVDRERERERERRGREEGGEPGDLASSE